MDFERRVATLANFGDLKNRRRRKQRKGKPDLTTFQTYCRTGQFTEDFGGDFMEDASCDERPFVVYDCPGENCYDCEPHERCEAWPVETLSEMLKWLLGHTDSLHPDIVEGAVIAWRNYEKLTWGPRLSRLERELLMIDAEHEDRTRAKEIRQFGGMLPRH